MVVTLTLVVVFVLLSIIVAFLFVVVLFFCVGVGVSVGAHVYFCSDYDFRVVVDCGFGVREVALLLAAVLVLM